MRKAIAANSLSLFVLDPAASAKVTEEPELENFLLQLAFLKIAQPTLYETGLKKLQAGGDVLEREEGCCRTAKTKVLFTASLAHCGCATYRS